MYKKILAVMAICMGIGSGALYAQGDGANASHNLRITIDPLMLVDIEGGNTIEFKLTDAFAKEAGAAFLATNLKNSSLYLNYSSIIEGERKHKILVRLNQARQQNGLILKLRLKPSSANNSNGPIINPLTNQHLLDGAIGNIGVVENSVYYDGTGVEAEKGIVLTPSDNPLITQIGTCYTGNGVARGYQLEYYIEFQQIGDINANLDENLTVIYTMVDN